MSQQQQKLSRDEACVVLMRHLFELFLEDQPECKANRDRVLPLAFLAWVDTKDGILDVAEIINKAGVTYEVWEYFRHTIVGNVAGPEMITNLWPQVTMANRSVPKNKLKYITWTLLYHFEDGRVFPEQVFALADLMTSSQDLRDGDLAMLLKMRNDAFVDSVIDYGIDGIHEKAHDYKGNAEQDAYDVLIGAFLLIVPQLKPQYQEKAKELVRLFQSIYRPPIPTQYLQAIESKKRAAQQGKDRPVIGGWD